MSAKLFRAAKGGDVDEVDELLTGDGSLVNATNKSLQTPLHVASIEGANEVVELLLAKRANPNATDKQGQTPLLSAILADKCDGGTIELLLSNKADPNLADSTGCTPLMAACQNASTDFVALLLNHKAEAASRMGPAQHTALHFAVATGDLELVSTLLEKPTNAAKLINAVDTNGLTALHHCGIKFPELVEVLRKHGADETIRDKTGALWNEVGSVAQQSDEESDVDNDTNTQTPPQADTATTTKSAQKPRTSDPPKQKTATTSNAAPTKPHAKGAHTQEEDVFIPKDVEDWLLHHNLGSCVVPFKRAKVQLANLPKLTAKDLAKMGLDESAKHEILALVQNMDPSEFAAPQFLRKMIVIAVLVLFLVPILARLVTMEVSPKPEL